MLPRKQGPLVVSPWRSRSMTVCALPGDLQISGYLGFGESRHTIVQGAGHA